jgi:hypothetical protein
MLDARGLKGLEYEIALARVKIAAIQRADPKSTTTFNRAMASLIRLVATHCRMNELASRHRLPRSIDGT